MAKLSIHINVPSVFPSEGYLVGYRPKLSNQPYSTVIVTSLPILISTNILPNIDYEGFIQIICQNNSGKIKLFKTNVFNNTVGKVKINKCGDNYSGNITSIKFNNDKLLPLEDNFPIVYGVEKNFVSFESGVKDLVITHSLTNSSIKVIDSNGNIYTQNTTENIIIFEDIIFNSLTSFTIEVNCNSQIL